AAGAPGPHAGGPVRLRVRARWTPPPGARHPRVLNHDRTRTTRPERWRGAGAHSAQPPAAPAGGGAPGAGPAAPQGPAAAPPPPRAPAPAPPRLPTGPPPPARASAAPADTSAGH